VGFIRSIRILEEGAPSPEEFPFNIPAIRAIDELTLNGKALEYPSSTIYLLDGSGIHETAYEDTEHYQLARDFLNNRDRYFAHLLK